MHPAGLIAEVEHELDAEATAGATAGSDAFDDLIMSPAGVYTFDDIQPPGIGVTRSTTSPRRRPCSTSPATPVEDDTGRLNYVVKIASRCNLNCSYCYVYNQADQGWRDRPSLMSRETFSATVERIRRHCVRSGQSEVTLCFHGGEPTLVGVERFEWMCTHARERLAGVSELGLLMQTNGTRLDAAWASAIRRHRVSVGVSLDGPAALNDQNRVDHRGRGSHAAVTRGVSVLAQAGLPVGILSVIAPGADPLATHEHFLSLGATDIGYLLPSVTHDTVAELREQFGATPVADFLIPIFDHWLEDTDRVRVREFRNIVRVILGGHTRQEWLGNAPVRLAFVETDGSLQGLDKLRSCEDGMGAIGLDVHHHDFAEIPRVSPFHGQVMRGLPVPEGCRGCHEEPTCAGGHLPNRYSRDRGFDNPSVWCADMLALLGHVRWRLGVSPADTARRRARLAELAQRRVPASV